MIRSPSRRWRPAAIGSSTATRTCCSSTSERPIPPAAAAAETLRAAGRGQVARDRGGVWPCASRLELALRSSTRFLLPAAKKRYAGLHDGVLEVVGLEAVRRDWTPAARRFQRALLERVFHDEPVADVVCAFVADLRAGRLDAELVYRKALRKPLDAYTRTTPPHVKAARRQAGPASRLVHYVMTRDGPEPAATATAPLDREHYVVHQLRPIADGILRCVGGPDFDDLTGRRRQLSLF
ncbi:MAG: DNA polymerase domain-containing protein [Candidatus Binatia bacterium]